MEQKKADHPPAPSSGTETIQPGFGLGSVPGEPLRGISADTAVKTKLRAMLRQDESAVNKIWAQFPEKSRVAPGVSHFFGFRELILHCAVASAEVHLRRDNTGGQDDEPLLLRRSIC